MIFGRSMLHLHLISKWQSIRNPKKHEPVMSKTLWIQKETCGSWTPLPLSHHDIPDDFPMFCTFFLRIVMGFGWSVHFFDAIPFDFQFVGSYYVGFLMWLPHVRSVFCLVPHEIQTSGSIFCCKSCWLYCESVQFIAMNCSRSFNLRDQNTIRTLAIQYNSQQKMNWFAIKSTRFTTQHWAEHWKFNRIRTNKKSRTATNRKTNQ